MGAEVDVPDLPLPTEAGQARKMAVIVDVNKLDRVRRQPSHNRIYLIQPRFCFPVLWVWPDANGTHNGRDASLARTGFDDGECFFFLKWIRPTHWRSSSGSRHRLSSSGRAMRAAARCPYCLAITAWSAGTFSLYLRAYWAGNAILDGHWRPPIVEKLSGVGGRACK